MLMTIIFLILAILALVSILAPVEFSGFE